MRKLCPDLAVAVLAGGASSRFGADKALYRICDQGPTLLERSVATGKRLSDRVAVIGHAKYLGITHGIPVYPDEQPGRGPLGGIATAFRVLDRPRVLVLACDMPCLSVALLRWMVALPTEADVVAPYTADGRYQTLHAIYRRSALPAIDRALAVGTGSIVSFYPDVDVRSVTEPEMKAFDAQLDSLLSVNHVENIERARRCVGCK
jgi:molybdopterin-guanine dinucleotide biosynthesis protein A